VKNKFSSFSSIIWFTFIFLLLNTKRKQMMKRRIYLLLVTALCLFTACGGDDDEAVKQIRISNPEQLQQKAYAQEQTTGEFTFTADGSWTIKLIKDVYLSETGKEEEGDSFIWMRFFDSEGNWVNKGNAGTHTLRVRVDWNMYKKTRVAQVEIVCGDDKIIVTLTQYGTAKDGEIPVWEYMTNSNILDEWLLSRYDTNRNGVLSEEEAAKVSEINLPYSSGTAIEGRVYLGDFPNLKNVNLKGHNILTIKINTLALEKLDLSANQLKEIELDDKLQSLKWIDISDNSLATFRARSPMLETLFCQNNTNLEQLIILESKVLKYIDCSNAPELAYININWDMREKYLQLRDEFIKKDEHTAIRFLS